MKENILLKKRYLISSDEVTSDSVYYAAKLLNTFGVTVDKPTKLTQRHVKLISDFYGEKIKAGFYNNPQDLKYYTVDELLLEQIVSYMQIEYFGVDSEEEEVFNRVELFKKALPNYEKGTEAVFREYKIITPEQADDILVEYTKNLASYTRPWSLTEIEEFKYLYINKYYKDFRISSKTNAMLMFKEFESESIGKSLDYKDVVKLSIELVGEKPKIKFNNDSKRILSTLLSVAKPVALTKKQAKFFNTIIKKLKYNKTPETNENSVYRKANILIKDGKIVEAAKVFAESGSMLERNLVYLLSRADLNQAQQIVDLIEVNNPIVVIQLVTNLLNIDKVRTFRFYAKNKIKSHRETTDEVNKRQSNLSVGMRNFLKDAMYRKVEDYYRNLPRIGKVFIDEEFKKVALPLNTTATGDGLDVYPTGSRLIIKGNYIRAFTYWENVFDIDTSVSFIKDSKVINTLYWGNYHTRYFGQSALTSGDDRGSTGSEYIDFRISELRDMGYTYAVYVINGYGGKLNKGNIYTGYQNKDNLDTQAWQPNNIELKIKVKGDSRVFIPFIIDLQTNEMIIINQMLNSSNRVITSEEYKTIEPYMNSEHIELFNVYNIASLRGDVIDNPEDADIVFSNNYNALENQLTVSTFEVDKLVKLLN